jgi:uncharacterized membrane protein
MFLFREDLFNSLQDCPGPAICDMLFSVFWEAQMSGPAVSAARPRTRSQGKLIFFVAFFALTAFVTYMKNAEIFHAGSPIQQHFAPGMVFLIPHAIFAGIALIMGAFQFSSRLRSRYLKVHRVMGYIYITCVFIGAPIAIPLAMRVATPSLVAASAVQAFGWMLCTGIALYCIRNGNVQKHRQWMIRGYPFATVFTVARLIIPIPPVLRTGNTGVEIVVWSAIAMAAILPTVILELPTLAPQRKLSQATTGD